MLTFEELSRVLEIGRSSNRLYKLSKSSRALIYAALNYTKMGNVIRSPYVLRLLHPIVRFLKEGVHEMQRASYPSFHSLMFREDIFNMLNKLRRNFYAKCKVRQATKCFLKLVISVPVKFTNHKLLSLVVKSLKEIKEALSPRFRFLKIGIVEAWKASMLAYSWGNYRALEWRRDRNFIIYWGAMLQNWPKVFQVPL